MNSRAFGHMSKQLFLDRPCLPIPKNFETFWEKMSEEQFSQIRSNEKRERPSLVPTGENRERPKTVPTAAARPQPSVPIGLVRPATRERPATVPSRERPARSPRPDARCRIVIRVNMGDIRNMQRGFHWNDTASIILGWAPMTFDNVDALNANSRFRTKHF